MLEELRALGRITATLHLALASESAHMDFRPEPITEADCTGWRGHMTAQVRSAMIALRGLPDDLRASLGLAHDAIDQLESECVRQIEDLSFLTSPAVAKSPNSSARRLP